MKTATEIRNTIEANNKLVAKSDGFKLIMSELEDSISKAAILNKSFVSFDVDDLISMAHYKTPTCFSSIPRDVLFELGGEGKLWLQYVKVELESNGYKLSTKIVNPKFDGDFQREMVTVSW